MFSINAVLPLFFIMSLGLLLKRKGFIDDAFAASATKVCFYVALPCMLFQAIVKNDITDTFDMQLIVFCVGGTLLCVGLLYLLTPHFIREVSSRSAFIQSCFRSNFALLGLPLINNIAGAPALAKAATVLAVIVPLFNVLAVLVLAKNQQQDNNWLILAKRIITNPLIIASSLGVIGSIVPFKLPLLLERPIANIADMAMPLALFTLGATFNFKVELKKMRLALSSVLLRLLVIPLAALIVAHMLHADPVQMAVTLALFAGPTAIACFPMAFQMGADHQLTSLTIVFSTSLSVVTIFSFVYALRVMGWI